MIIYPSIDVKDGKSVKIVQGNLNDIVILDNDPFHIAARYQKLGFKWLHIIDLDGAKAGHPVNVDAIAKILQNIDLPAQVGGGIRALEHIDLWFERGASQVVLGTLALEKPDVLKEACAKYPGKIVVSLDAKDGFITTSGWTNRTDVRLLDLALRVEKMGVAAIIYTDVDRDGAQLGINADVAIDLAWSLTIPVIVNGGVASIEDLTAIKSEQRSGLMGVIVGTSLHDGRIDPHAALRILEDNEGQAA